MDPLISEWQIALPSFGINYSGPTDGKINAQFITAMFNLESKLKMYGELFNGAKPLVPVSKIKDKLPKPESKSEEPQDLKPTPLPPKPADPDDIQSQVEAPQNNKEWEVFLKSSLPVAGNIWDGNVETTAKKLESIISSKINKSIAGMIWNDSTKSFNTSTQDVKSALEKLEKHDLNKKSYSKKDDRLAKMAEIMKEYDLKKISGNI